MKKIFLSLTILSLFGLISCSKEKPDFTPDVNIVLSQKKDMPVYAEYVGQTFGESDIDIVTRVEGWVTGIHFKEGNEVKKGDLLYTIDDIELQNKMESSQADLAKAQTRLTKAKSDLARIEPLAKINALSQRDLDDAKANYDAALSEVTIAKSRLNNSQIELGYSKILAPVSGIIGISRVQVGDYVGRGVNGKALNTISTTKAMKVRFSIPENEYLQIARFRADNNMEANEKVETPVTLILSDGSTFDEQGLIDFYDRQIDPETGSLIVQASFKNTDGLLRPGLYVKVKIQVQMDKDAVIIPESTINQVQNMYQVYVVNDSNKVSIKPVEIGAREDGFCVIKSGVQVGEKVAILGSTIIKTGMVVKPVLLDSTATETAKQK